MAASTLDHGQLALTGSAQQLLPTYTEAGRTILIRAHSANTGKVYLGKAGVTNTTGYELAAGEGVALDYFSPQTLYVIGTAADRVSYIVLR